MTYDFDQITVCDCHFTQGREKCEFDISMPFCGDKRKGTAYTLGDIRYEFTNLSTEILYKIMEDKIPPDDIRFIFNGQDVSYRSLRVKFKELEEYLREGVE